MGRKFTFELTEKQKLVLQTIKDFKKENDCYPTVRELAIRLELSASSIQSHLRLLYQKSYIFMIPKISRNIRINYEKELKNETN